MKKLLLFFMASMLMVTTSCTMAEVEVVLPEIKDPTVTLVPIDSDSDTGLFASNCLETEYQSWLVVVDNNETLYESADGTQLKSWVSSSDAFTVDYNRTNSTITVVPSAYNYNDDFNEAVITVTLNNNIGAGATTIDVKQEFPTFAKITFEQNSGLTTPSGTDVAVSDTEYNGYTYPSIMIATEDKYTFENGKYDDILFSTADELVTFYHYYGQSVTSSYSDDWAGFALSQNYTQDEMTDSSEELFSVWAPEEIGNTFAIARYNGDGNSYEGTYETPVIKFDTIMALASIRVANTNPTYKYETYMHEDSVLYMNVVFTGYLDEYTEMGSVSVELITTDSTRVEDWIMVDLSSIDSINSLKITMESNDYNAMTGCNVPGYIAIDDLKYVDTW